MGTVKPVKEEEKALIEDAEILGESDPLIADAPNPGFLAASEGLRVDPRGKRVSAFRKTPGPPAGVTASKKAIMAKRRVIVSRALSSGASPLDVILDNMRWASLRAHKLEQAAQGILTADLEDDLVRLREMATDAAYKVAPYLHPKLAPLVAKGEKGLTVNLVIEDA